MHSSNPPPLNTSFSSVTPPRRSSSVVFEPYALHILSSIIKDLQFLRQQGYITITALDEIIEKLPKPVPHVTPHTPPPALSPSTSPRSKSPAVSVKSDTSQKRISNFIAPQRPLSAPSEISPQQEQERSLSHPLAQIEPIVEVEVKEGDQNQQSQQQSQQQQQQQQQQQTKPLPITFPPPPPIQPQNDQNDQNDQIDQNDGVVNAGQPQLDNQSLITKPAVPSRLSVIIPQSNSSASSSTGTLGTVGGTGTTGGTGAILATRPLPLPPNASNSSPPRPQPLPVFNSKQEEAEYEKSMSFQVYKEQMLPALPAYSLSVVEAMWDFMSDDAGDLSFSKGDIIEVVEYVNADWWRGRIQRTNKIGIFPKVYTKIIPEQAMANNGYYSQQRITSQHSNNISAYTSQAILPYVQQSPSLQQQQLPIQQQLQLQTQQNYTAYQQQYVNQTTYLNSRSSTNSLNGQQQQFYRNL